MFWLQVRQLLLNNGVDQCAGQADCAYCSVPTLCDVCWLVRYRTNCIEVAAHAQPRTRIDRMRVSAYYTCRTICRTRGVVVVVLVVVVVVVVVVGIHVVVLVAGVGEVVAVVVLVVDSSSSSGRSECSSSNT